MAIYKIQNGFSIVDSNNVEGQQIDGIKTSIAASPSDSKLATEKAVKDYVDAHSGAVQSVSDTDSVDLSVDGNGDLTADVRLSSATGNTAQIISTSGEEGLFVPASEGDHKTQVSSADAIPNYLYDKIETFSAPAGLIRKGIHGNVDGSKTLQLGIDATSATNGQVLTAEDIDGVCYPKWKNPTGGMTNPMTTAGDIIVGGTSGAPDRLGAGTDGEVLTLSSGAPTWAAPATQPGDHQLLVSATDAAAGYLGAKLTAGSNVTLTPQTDGDGVQTIEISATGGGGGGGARMLFTNGVPNCAFSGQHGSNYESIYVAPFFAQFDKVGSIALLPYGLSTDTRIVPPTLDLCVYEGETKSVATKITSFTYSAPASWSFGVPLWFDFNAVVDIDLLKNHWVAVKCSSWATGYRHNWVLTASQNTSAALGDANSFEMARSYRQLNAGAGSLPDALSGISGNTYLDYGLTLWYSASTTKMHS